MQQTLKRTDSMLHQEVSEQLAWDSRLDASGISTTVTNGEVVLGGYVPSFAQRLLAENTVRAVPWVRSVRNELAIMLPATPGTDEDRRTRENIVNLIKIHSEIDERKVAVAVTAGTVTLEGTVASFWQKVKVESIAAEVTGVTGIANKLSVVPTRDIADEMIAEDITTALGRTMAVDITSINVEVVQGTVTLGGIVNDRIAFATASEIVHCTEGVINVINNLIIERLP